MPGDDFFKEDDWDAKECSEFWQREAEYFINKASSEGIAKGYRLNYLRLARRSLDNAIKRGEKELYEDE